MKSFPGWVLKITVSALMLAGSAFAQEEAAENYLPPRDVPIVPM